jgi:hypothetical protein
MRNLFLALIFLLFAGCSETVTPAQQENIQFPAWVTDPNFNGLRGSVGSSAPHFKGPAYQRSLAISRALDELAMEMGVQVSVDLQREEKANGYSVKSKSDIKTKQAVNNSNVTAHIEATFINPQTNELYVWMVLN